ncbi:uncharacterized protein LOC124305341 [Neodiprion virginianus]|uniref:uncharacterized protein LOC124305341 n=1 Tax=Neodiprion virginianus TaxID=2961670 RepID=UPI001EE6E2D2|nr:uncharacterized protein LOC124305341 [Neodiprion virginianus]
MLKKNYILSEIDPRSDRLENELAKRGRRRNNRVSFVCFLLMNSRRKKMSSSSSSKGTRKTYSFEEREILITLINKHGDVEDKKSDPTSMCKRKSAWTKLAEEYNALVGPYATRSSVQLRRCWENMKACKRNREEKRSGPTSKGPNHNISSDRLRLSLSNWQDGVSGQNSIDTSTSASTVGLPPNVVFEPKASEPFTLQSVPASKASKMALKGGQRGDLEGKEPPPGIAVLTSGFTEAKMELPPSVGPMGDCPEKFMTDPESSIEDVHSDTEDPAIADARGAFCIRSNSIRPSVPSPCRIPQNRLQRRIGSAAQRSEELHVLALSEAQIKVDIAAMQKEEARIRLEEVRYRKEEARLRMLFFTYKLDRLKED